MYISNEEKLNKIKKLVVVVFNFIIYALWDDSSSK